MGEQCSKLCPSIKLEGMKQEVSSNLYYYSNYYTSIKGNFDL